MTDALPVILSETAHANGSIVLRLYLAEDLSLFAGHFPGLPLLPGVAQVHWAAELAGTRLALTGRFSRLVNLKFQKPILPGCELDLALSWDAGRRQLAFNYASAAGCHASGKIEFGAGEDRP